jgi:hypothetical protein
MTPSEVYDILRTCGATELHHANTVTTSCTFLEQGALVSRGFAELHCLSQTPQGSDDIDKKYGIWNSIFLDHVDIHYRAGRKKGPNQYGPVLFVLDLDVLLHLPAGTNVRVTRMNPVHWSNKQEDNERWFQSNDEIRANLNFGDFDKMLVIDSPNDKVEFPDTRARISLDNPNRKMSDGEDAYSHAEQRLKVAAQNGGIIADIAPHRCRDGCVCIAKYARYQAGSFDSIFL